MKLTSAHASRLWRADVYQAHEPDLLGRTASNRQRAKAIAHRTSRCHASVTSDAGHHARKPFSHPESETSAVLDLPGRTGDSAAVGFRGIAMA